MIQLIGQVRPPQAVDTDKVMAARVLLSADIPYPDEYWRLLETYGAGTFYEDDFELLHPCTPSFTLDFALCVNELAAASGALPEVQNHSWLPVAKRREWALFVEASDDPVRQVLFACLGSDGEFAVVAGGIASFIRRYATPELQEEVFGGEGRTPLSVRFTPASSVLGLDATWLESEVAENSDLAFLPRLASELKSCLLTSLEVTEP